MSLPLDVHRLLPAFLNAAQCENFSAAARQLGITPAAVSKNIRLLEQKLGLRLFQRNTHRVMLTDEGRHLLARVAPLWQALSATLETTPGQQQAPRGTIRLSVIPGFASQLLLPLLSDFVARYPLLDIDLSLDARVVNLVAEGFDLAIGTRIDPDSRVVARHLYNLRMTLAAAPDYLQRQGLPEHPHQLAQHQCLLYRNPDSGRQVKWRLQQDGSEQVIDVPGRIILNQQQSLLQATLAGLGIAYLADWYSQPAFANNTLQPILANCWPAPQPLWLYYASADLPPRVRVLVDYLLAHFAPGNYPNSANTTANSLL